MVSLYGGKLCNPNIFPQLSWGKYVCCEYSAWNILMRFQPDSLANVVSGVRPIGASRHSDHFHSLASFNALTNSIIIPKNDRLFLLVLMSINRFQCYTATQTTAGELCICIECRSQLNWNSRNAVIIAANISYTCTLCYVRLKAKLIKIFSNASSFT
jgi:hypothetical protein